MSNGTGHSSVQSHYRDKNQHFRRHSGYSSDNLGSENSPSPQKSKAAKSTEGEDRASVRSSVRGSARGSVSSVEDFTAVDPLTGVKEQQVDNRSTEDDESLEGAAVHSTSSDNVPELDIDTGKKPKKQ